MERVKISMNTISDRTIGLKPKRKADGNIKYKKFSSIFEKIDVIENLDAMDISDVESLNFKLQYDLFTCDLHDFKLKEPKAPSFRVVILR
jgi:hypothetical protein